MMNEPTAAPPEKIPSLLDQVSIPVYPALAKKFGVNEAIVIQQIYFYMSVNCKNKSERHFRDDKWWVYNTYEQWCDEHFPWLTPRGLQSIVRNLETQGILLSKQGVENRYDRRKWYSIDLEKLNEALKDASMHPTKNASSKAQFLHDDSTENTYREETTNDSPAEKSTPEQHAACSPDGDARAEQAAEKESGLLREKDHGQTEQPQNALSVKAPATDLKSTPAHGTEDSLPVSQASSARPPILPPRPRPVLERPPARPAQTPQSASTHSHSTKSQPPSTGPTSAGKGRGLSPTTGIPPGGGSPPSPPLMNTRPTAAAPNTPLQAAVMHAFKVARGSYAGRIGQFFAGKIPRQQKDRWAQFQPETPVTPPEILALLLWYGQHPAYAVSFIEHGSKLPSTPGILRDRLDEFRDSPDHDRFLQAAQPLLERLLQGTVPAPNTAPVPDAPAKVVEAAAAYSAYDVEHDSNYVRPNNPNIASSVNDLFSFGGAQ